MNHWIVIADAASCTLYSADETLEALHPLRVLREHSGNVHGHHAHLAKELAHALEEGSRTGQYERLILVAPPRFLGELRDLLSPRVEARIVASIHHDLAKTPIHALPGLVRKHLPETAGIES